MRTAEALDALMAASPGRLSLREQIAAWAALSPEQKSVEIDRIERLERALAERAALAKKQARRDRLRALSGVEARFVGALLTDLDWRGNEPAHSAAMAALDTRSGWFHGPVGVAKTHIAAALVNDAVAHDRHAVLISGLSMLARIKSSYDDAGLVKPECVDVVGKLSSVPVLALDDLGKERFTGWAAEQFMLLLDARYSKNLPLIVTSNYTPRQLESHWNASGMDGAYGGALVRRIVAMTGSPVEVVGRR